MNIQELEHWQHVDGQASELENLYRQSRGEHSASRVNRDYVNYLSSLGFYVVIMYTEMFCRFTDATLGVDSDIVLVTRCSEQAREYSEDEDFEIVYPEC